MDFSRKVSLKPIDPDQLKIEKSYEFEEAYAVWVELDSSPDHVWTTLFYQQLKESLYSMKRQVTVDGNKLRIVTAPDEVKDKIEWVKGLVKSTNERVEAYNKEVEQERTKGEEKRLREQEAIQKMKDSLKK
jgi:hypothetical protein